MIFLSDENQNDNPKKEESESAFNGAVLTLKRIDELIRHISFYAVNDHLIGYKRNLSELLIESQGCLNKTEYIKAWRDWALIEQKFISVKIIEDKLIYDIELKPLLFKFNAWIRLKLHRHLVTWAGKKELRDGLTSQYKKYGLQ